MQEELKNIDVIKRDGKIVPFDRMLIFAAIKSAFKATGELEDSSIDRASMRITSAVVDKIAKGGYTSLAIAKIQSIVELELARAYPVSALAYVEYRYERDVARDRQSSFFSDIVGLRSESDARLLNENANKDAKLFSTKRDLLAGIVSKEFAKKYILPKHIVRAHERGIIHYHDLDYAPFMKGMFNCMLVDIKGMLETGFTMGEADIEPPKSIMSAAAITAQILCQVSNHIYGGVSVHAIDIVLAPYVAKSHKRHLDRAKKYGIKDAKAYADELTKKETYDAFQGLEYSINCINTCQGQTPFTTLGLSGYDTSYEARLITWAILQVRIDGLGRDGKTAIFPKLVYTIRKGYNYAKGEPNYDLKCLALRCAAKRIYPDILNYDRLVAITGGYKTPMGCRSFLGSYKDAKGKEVYAGRNNLGVITLNLVRIALDVAHGRGVDRASASLKEAQSKMDSTKASQPSQADVESKPDLMPASQQGVESRMDRAQTSPRNIESKMDSTKPSPQGIESRMDRAPASLKEAQSKLDSTPLGYSPLVSAFFALLDERLELCKEALLTRIDAFIGVKASVSPILYMQGACGVRLGADEEILSIFKDGRASISLGYIGLSECVNALLGARTSILHDREKYALSLAILKRLRDKTLAWKEAFGYGFSLYGTPAESLCYRFLQLDREAFGVIEGVSDKEYYTNSFHLDVKTSIDPFAKLDFEAPYPALASGGFINYVETPNLANNLAALEQIWDYSYDKVPYYGTNQPVDACYECGFEGEFIADERGFACPSCANANPATISVTRRVCGYLGSPLSREFNKGKLAEVKARVKHMEG